MRFYAEYKQLINTIYSRKLRLPQKLLVLRQPLVVLLTRSADRSFCFKDSVYEPGIPSNNRLPVAQPTVIESSVSLKLIREEAALCLRVMK